MSPHLEKNCEGVDAAVFTGDVLYDDDSRAELKEYIGRWTRAIAEHERSEPEPTPEDDAYPFYELKFIMRVLGHEGNAPRQDWQTAYGMAQAIF